ncbi:MAG: type IV toxin-antitoxin system AbiEi family antitoxin domain-containing protein [Nocardioidaceae bacterium]|nr:type IV toxin-antitoxin system AbiEi family antitoxin domain-containing protein [Nocardioidaceae bacterium]
MYRRLTIEEFDSVTLRREALDQGYDDRAIRRLVRAGVWRKVRHGAYAITEVWDAVSPQDRHRLLARAVLRTAHGSSVLSHVSAAVEWGAPTWGIDLGWVHLTRGDGQTSRRESGVVRHSGVLSAGDVLVREGVALTSGCRAALEVTTVAAVEPALVVVNGLLHAGATTRAELEKAMPLFEHWPNSLTARVVLGLSDSRISSAGESRLYHLCWKAGLPLPVPQVLVEGLEDRFTAFVDFAWPELGVFMEFDGREKYERYRREGETLEQFLLREKRREELICQLTGWICIRITWVDLGHPVRTAARIRNLLASRGSLVGAPMTPPGA